jgi:glucose-6-phosphate-specific signal transduction histidine kinase
MANAFDLEQIRLTLESVPGVIRVGDLHLWPIESNLLETKAETAGLATQLEIVDMESWQSLKAMILQRLSTIGINQTVIEPLVSSPNQISAPAKQDLGLAMALKYEQQWQSERHALAESLSQQLSEHTITIKTLASTIESRLSQDAEFGTANASLSNIASLLVGSANALFESLRLTLSSIRTTDPEHSGLLQATRSLIADTQLAEPKRRLELFLQPEDQSTFGIGEAGIEALAFKLVQVGLQESMDDANVKATVVSLRATTGVLTVHISDDGQAPGTKFRPLSEELNSDLRAEVELMGGIFNLGKGDSGGFELWVTLPWPGV